ncbi:hypothetical protein OG539_27795 [Actinacidiphila glaucinigra]|uniref:hypothetical protein n=1 Tax=Actinacidiphila glaucinigra TaxID=235986 RepID=UPI002DDA4151|nr:hypothetical protein [Actinacidiphila glaucinigra]WSD60158.1 hypothetical protein OIE69_15110 [Actinacidiphila glaucinigra]
MHDTHEPAPSGEALPDLSGLDVSSLAGHAGRPALTSLAPVLQARNEAGGTMVAFYEDGIFIA